VGSALSQASDWSTFAALIVAPGVLARAYRFASSGRAVITAEGLFAGAPRLSGLVTSFARVGAPLLAGASLVAGCGGEEINSKPKTPQAVSPSVTLPKADFDSIEYDPKKNPFAVNPRLQKIVREVYAQGGDPILPLFERLRVGGPEKVLYAETPGYNLTAAQTLERGGDCSDLGNLTIAAIQELNRLGSSIQGGAYKVHFKGKPANLVHIVPYVIRDGKRLLLDLQAPQPGQTLQGEFEILLDYPSFDQAAALYHAEWGGYFFEKRDWARAMEAYQASARIFANDPKVVRNLHAAVLNYHSSLADQAFQDKKWDDCARHSQEALASALSLGDDARSQITELESNIEKCLNTPKAEKLNQAINQAQAAFDRKEWSACITQYETALSWIRQLPRGAEVEEIESSIQYNLSICRKNK
jgi:hypothetical protein